jgi:hypothetical protein
MKTKTVTKKTNTATKTDPLAELLDAAKAQGEATVVELHDANEARAKAVVVLYTAFGGAIHDWNKAAGDAKSTFSAQQLEDACRREITALACAHLRFLEAEYALTREQNR